MPLTLSQNSAFVDFKKNTLSQKKAFCCDSFLSRKKKNNKKKNSSRNNKNKLIYVQAIFETLVETNRSNLLNITVIFESFETGD